MADDLPGTEAASTNPLKLTRPSSPVQKTNSNTHNAVDGSTTTAMSNTSGSVKRIRSFDADDQDATSNSSSPKRPRLVEDGDETTTNCKSPTINNKDGNDEAPAKNGEDTDSKTEHLTSNGALGDSKLSEESSIDCSKPNSEASIDGASDGDVLSQPKTECVDKDEDSQNGPSTEVDETPKNGAPSEHIKGADESAVSVSKDHNGPLETNDKSTLKDSESDNERTGSSAVEKLGDKLCDDTNAKESDSNEKVIPKDDQGDEESMEVDVEDVNVSKSKENGVEATSESGEKKDTSETADKKESKEGSESKKDNSEATKDESKKDESEVSKEEESKKDESEVSKEESKKDESEVSKEASKKDESEVSKVESKDAETAMDTSEKDDTKGKKSGDSDIIELSDDSAPEAVEASHSADDTSRSPSPIPEPTDPLGNLSDEQLEKRDTIVKRLNEDLRNEEAKLLLLKKLRQSQQQPAPTEPKEDPNNIVDASRIIGRNQQTTLPPPLVPGPGQLKPQLSNQASQLAQQQRLQMPQLIRGGNLQQAQSGHHGNVQSGPPPLVLARGGLSNMNSLQAQQQQQMNRNQMIRMISTSHITGTSNSLSTAQHARVSATNSAQETQSAASRQAAAKLALRKQLEKTLLQIPPPKPPPPELHFLPSAANNEFIILVGLEEVVNTILDLEKRDKSKKDPKYLAPFRCAQCKTDFTTIWKQGSKQGIMCENCIVSNQKKALKAEHTNRLKTAFVKALQQEQEIEQRMQQSHTAAQAAAAAGSLNIPKINKVNKINKVPLAHTHQGHHSIQVMQQQQQQQHNRQRVMNPAPAQRTMQPVTYAYIPQVSGVNIAGIQMIPKQQFVAGHHGIVTASDRQREYLLDMISNKSGSNISGWKR